MQRYESFGECLKRCLKEAGMSASEVARLVGFRSRNSIFRILSGEASDDIKLRFLDTLYELFKDSWPRERWVALEEALTMERLGPERYLANQAFRKVLHEHEQEIPVYMVYQVDKTGAANVFPLTEMLDRIAASARAEIIITGCCDSSLSHLLADYCGEAGKMGKLKIRHYIDVAENVVTQNILGILPLISKSWYNARLVDVDTCPPQMLSIYRVHSLYIHCWDEQGNLSGQRFLRYDETNFFAQSWIKGPCPTTALLNRWRFHLELLKPLPALTDGAEVFVEYTRQYAQMEENCTILSIKPDIYFNCIPTELLERAVLEGASQSDLPAGPELVALIDALKKVHDGRFDNMIHKHKPTHMVYSLPAMERFMRTGLLSDHFFIQRAYTVEERRQIIRVLLDAMRNQPYFNLHFFKEGTPALRYEITLFEGRGVLLMDAYTGYELDADHSEALITLPAFMKGFQQYFKDELLAHYVISRAETIRHLERLLVMKIKE